jgi:hypothetical protein
MNFIKGRTYKFMLQKGYEQNSVYTITVEDEDDRFVSGIDKKNEKRGIKKDLIVDWILLEN